MSKRRLRHSPFKPQEHSVACPECGARMVLKWSQRFWQWFYSCERFPECRATHGCHPDGSPLGVPANAETKRARMAAHAAFDRLWKSEGASMSRGEAYKLMQELMGMTPEQAHIGRFDKAQCERLVQRLLEHTGAHP